MKTFLRNLVGWIFRLFWHIEIQGEENLPADIPVMIVANHSNMLDPFLISTCYPYNATALAKKELWKSPFLRPFLKALDAEPVDRAAGDIRAIRRCIEILQEMSLVIFPEGTRNRTAIQLEAKPGAALIARKAGVAMLPVTIAGNFRPFSKLVLIYHPLVHIEELGYTQFNSTTYEEICNDMMTTIYDAFRVHMRYED